MEALLPLNLVEPLFAVFSGILGSQNTSTFFNSTTSGLDGAPVPHDLASLFAFFYSSKALRDYLKLIVLGSAFETLRRLYYSASSINVWERFFITASFDSEDVSFDWMMLWLSTLPNWRKFRDFTVSTNSLSLEDNGLELEDEEDTNPDQPLRKRARKVRYLPAYATSYRLWYKRRLVWISRVKEESRWASDKSTLHITILGTDRSVLDALINDAKNKWLSARKDKIDIYTNEGFCSDWRFVCSRPQRPMNSIVLDAGVKELILDDAHDFLRSKQWYADRGIPFRRGYLLYGAPGSGKTSIIHSLAGELGLDIYVLSLSKAGIDDSSLNHLICNLPERCIALMEDIDAAFVGSLTRDATGTELEDPRAREARQRRESEGSSDDEDGQPSGGEVGPSNGSRDSRVTLSGLLNALDGVSAQEGRLLFATTNRYAALDAALIRPGRMDLHVEFKLASSYQACELFKRFYRPNIIASTSDSTVDGAADSEEEEEKDAVSDSGYGGTPERKEQAPLPSPVTIDKSINNLAVSGTHHTNRSPKLSMKQVDRLAARFSTILPEREFSMATLQGYLMGYKTRPVLAVDELESWVQSKREDAERKAKLDRTKMKKLKAKKAAVAKKAEGEDS